MKKKIGIGILVFLVLAILIGIVIGVYRYNEMKKFSKEMEVSDSGIIVSNKTYVIATYQDLGLQEVTEIYLIDEQGTCVSSRKQKKDLETTPRDLAKEEFYMRRIEAKGIMFTNEQYEAGVITYNNNVFNGKSKEEIYNYLKSKEGISDLKIIEI